MSEPLTDKDLEHWASAGGGEHRGRGFRDEVHHLRAGVVRLVAEVRRLREVHAAMTPDIFNYKPLADFVMQECIEELRRLRSDEWLEKAAGAFCDQWISEPEYGAETPARAKRELCNLLRKHRDGKA